MNLFELADKKEFNLKCIYIGDSTPRTRDCPPGSNPPIHWKVSIGEGWSPISQEGYGHTIEQACESLMRKVDVEKIKS